jgi:hypothetical protein
VRIYRSIFLVVGLKCGGMLNRACREFLGTYRIELGGLVFRLLLRQNRHLVLVFEVFFPFNYVRASLMLCPFRFNWLVHNQNIVIPVFLSKDLMSCSCECKRGVET